MKTPINQPNPACEDKCVNAKKALLFIANNQTDHIDLQQIRIICAKCNASLWQITTKK